MVGLGENELLKSQYQRAMASGRTQRANEKEVELKVVSHFGHYRPCRTVALYLHYHVNLARRFCLLVMRCAFLHYLQELTLQSHSSLYGFDGRSCSQLRDPLQFASAKFMAKLTGTDALGGFCHSIASAVLLAAMANI